MGILVEWYEVLDTQTAHRAPPPPTCGIAQIRQNFISDSVVKSNMVYAAHALRVLERLAVITHRAGGEGAHSTPFGPSRDKYTRCDGPCRSKVAASTHTLPNGQVRPRYAITVQAGSPRSAGRNNGMGVRQPYAIEQIRAKMCREPGHGRAYSGAAGASFDACGAAAQPGYKYVQPPIS